MSNTEQITSSDNTHYLHHTFFDPSDNTTPITATLLIVHGMAEHSGRYAELAQFLADNGIAVATYDQLGHGQTVKSANDLGFFAEEHPVQSLLKDVIIMADSLKARHPNVPHFVMGHSMGSFIVRNVLKHHAQNFTGAILMGTADANPLTKVLLPINKVLNSKLDNRISSSEFAWLNEDPQAIEAYEADPLTGFDFTNNGFLTLFSLMEAGLNKNWAITIAKDFPMLLVSGENDPIGDMGKGIRKIASRLEKLNFSNITLQLYPHMRHEPIHEQNKQQVYQDIVDWINSNTAA